MCRLETKIKLIGSKKYSFRILINLSRNLPIKGKFRDKLGIWNTQTNIKITRYIVIDIYKFIYLYKNYGLKFNSKTLTILYYFFNSNYQLNYFSTSNLKLLLHYEINKKYFKTN